jgi:hypothetical protein
LFEQDPVLPVALISSFPDLGSFRSGFEHPSNHRRWVQLWLLRAWPMAAKASTRSCGRRGDQRPAGWFRFAHQNLWDVAADLFRPGGIAGPGISTVGGGSRCWSKSSMNSSSVRCLGEFLHIVLQLGCSVLMPGVAVRQAHDDHGSLCLGRLACAFRNPLWIFSYPARLKGHTAMQTPQP